MSLQRDLGIALSSIIELSEALDCVLAACLKIERVDCGAIYLLDAEAGEFRLAAHCGLSPSFEGNASCYPVSSPHARLAMRGHPLYRPDPRLESVDLTVAQDEGVRAVGVVPVQHEGRVTAALVLGSHLHDDFSPATRIAMEAIATQVGGAIARAKASAALEQSEEKLASILNALVDHIVIIDEHLTITWANESARQRFGPDLVGKKCCVICHQHEEDFEPCAVRRTFADGGSHDQEVMLVRGSQSLTFWCTANPVIRRANGKPKLVVKVCRDVTARRHEEEESRLRLQELAHVARLVTMGEMASAITHEISQPLGAIATYASACVQAAGQSQGAPSTRLQELLEKIEAQALRAGEIVRRMRGLARKTTSSRSTVAINEVVEEAIQLLAMEYRLNRVSLRSELEPSVPTVLGDRIQLQQVIINLARNALEAIVDADCLTREVVIATSVLDQDKVEVTVRDSGPGIPPERIDRVFDAFFTTKTRGLGLGLAISRSIVEAHGGRLEATPNHETGCMFRFTLLTTPREQRRDEHGADRLHRG